MSKFEISPYLPISYAMVGGAVGAYYGLQLKNGDLFTRVISTSLYISLGAALGEMMAPSHPATMVALGLHVAYEGYKYFKRPTEIKPEH